MFLIPMVEYDNDILNNTPIGIGARIATRW